ncbi:OCIA domain-containing protein 1-like [Nematolebias whitei]|uniref:OCIA domain-containing protein 1-like n=1 Tax=Nematolebias whitei TaxID=451745 RepID=UPI0018975C6C|nr:OCIA domain-containing protein 1-like [Nematolebias whitei]
MSSPSFTEEVERRDDKRNTKQNALRTTYTPTEEEVKVLNECFWESLFYRAVPFSVISMATTKHLISRGILSVSPRFGYLPKVCFAGFFGYIAGRLSYLKKCREKFENLPDSQFLELMRQQARLSSLNTQPEVREPNVPSYDTLMFQPAETPSSMSSFTTGDGQMGEPDDTPVQSFEDEEPKKSILYENLRLRNRENYEVMLNQKADTVIKAPSEKERPKKPVMKNIYGDTWEE